MQIFEHVCQIQKIEYKRETNVNELFGFRFCSSRHFAGAHAAVIHGLRPSDDEFEGCLLLFACVVVNASEKIIVPSIETAISLLR